MTGFTPIILFLLLGAGAVSFVFAKKTLHISSKNLTERFISEIKNIKLANNFVVPDSIILAVLKMESDDLYKTKNNSDIIGDVNLTNKAFGYMQVRKPALLDVNARYGFSYKENDLLSEHINLIVGIGYLNMCFIQSGVENANDIPSLTMKKYNAGIGTKEISLRGSFYALTGKNFYNEFNSLG